MNARSNPVSGIQIIKRDSIPPITSVEEGGVLHRLGELRDLSWSEPWKNFVNAGSGFAASWVQLAHREVLEPHAHPVLSMMVFYAGSGEMLGDLARPLAGDEVVVVPPGCLHGFVGGPSGLQALSIQFAGGLYSTPDQPRVVFSKDDQSLEQLLEFSQARAAGFARNPLFDVVPRTVLSNSAKRRVLRAAVKVWVDGTESISATRYASCDDPRYQAAFRDHLLDCVERAPDSSGAPAAPPAVRDAALEAISNWFGYQMYVLDNAEKTAIVCLVVDRVTTLFGEALALAMGDCPTSQALRLQARTAEQRIAGGVDLLRHATPRDYARCQELVGEAWDMAEALADRLTAMTLGAHAA
jgi:hypothetical protein